MKPITIRVPATTANLGPGFDCLGMALDLFNDFTVFPQLGEAFMITGLGACAGVAGSENIFFDAYRRVFAMAGQAPVTVGVEVDGEIPMARGLGSSATAIVAGALAANAILEDALSAEDLLLAMTREEGHPDNVAPAFLGSLTACVDLGKRVLVKSVQPHSSWRLALLIPEYQLSTEKARKAIPAEIPIRDAVFNLTRIPFILDALAQGNGADLAALMEDRLHEPYRRELVRGYDAIRQSALEAGASAVYLSGAGPTMAAFCLGDEIADRTCVAMMEGFCRSFSQEEIFIANMRVAKPWLDGSSIKLA